MKNNRELAKTSLSPSRHHFSTSETSPGFKTQNSHCVALINVL